MDWINDKTGYIYRFITTVTDATNSRDGNKVVLYADGMGRVFCRDADEFYVKFTVKV